MAEQLSEEDFTEFVDSIRSIIERTASVYHASDHVGLEICARKLEELKIAYRHITVPKFLSRPV